MNRPIVVAVGVMALAGSLAFVWLDARQQREYRRLLAAGDEAVAYGQTLEAIEAFSGALTLKPDLMIARLMRGETYRQRGEFASAGGTSARRPHSTPAHRGPGIARRRPGLDAPVCRRCQQLRAQFALGRSALRASSTSWAWLTIVSDIPAAIEALQRAVSLDDRLAAGALPARLCFAIAGREQAERPAPRCRVEPTPAAAREELVTSDTDLVDNVRPSSNSRRYRPSSQRDPNGLVRAGLAYARLGRQDVAAQRSDAPSNVIPIRPSSTPRLVACGLPPPRTGSRRLEQGDRSAGSSPNSRTR